MIKNGYRYFKIYRICFCFIFIFLGVYGYANPINAEILQNQLIKDDITFDPVFTVIKLNFTGTIENFIFNMTCINTEGCIYDSGDDAFSINFYDDNCNIILSDYYNLEYATLDYNENRDFIIDLTIQGETANIENGYFLRMANLPPDYKWNGAEIQTDFFVEYGGCPTETPKNVSGYYIINGISQTDPQELTAISALGAVMTPIIDNTLELSIIIFSDYWGYIIIISIISILILYIINFVNKIIK